MDLKKTSGVQRNNTKTSLTQGRHHKGETADDPKHGHCTVSTDAHMHTLIPQPERGGADGALADTGWESSKMLPATRCFYPTTRAYFSPLDMETVRPGHSIT